LSGADGTGKIGSLIDVKDQEQKKKKKLDKISSRIIRCAALAEWSSPLTGLGKNLISSG